MLAALRPALLAVLVFTLLTGIVYPLVITGIGGVLWPQRAAGSMVTVDGRPAGSSLIAQGFAAPRYLWPRPSATGPDPWNAAASSGSNLGPTNPALTEAVSARIATLREQDPGATAAVPVDLVTSSGSGLDPHVSPAAARFQASRIAQARGVPVERVLAVIDEHVEPRTFGLLGEPRVNVLAVNLALDARLR
jgi:K+-transporting ATPase ATPase C chain